MLDPWTERREVVLAVGVGAPGPPPEGDLPVRPVLQPLDREPGRRLRGRPAVWQMFLLVTTIRATLEASGRVGWPGAAHEGSLEGAGDDTMLGSIAGDVIGSVYEARPIKTTQFRLFHPLCRFTDDTVLTVALADSLLHGTPYVDLLKAYYRAYPNAG